MTRPTADPARIVAAIEAQLLMGHSPASPHLALDRATILDYSWDVDLVRQALAVPANTLWDQRVLELEAQGLASFCLYSAPVTWDEQGNESVIPGRDNQLREHWGSVCIYSRGVLTLATLYGRPFVRMTESRALAAHWQAVQAESAARTTAQAAAYAAGPEALAAHEAQWAHEYPEQAARWQAVQDALRRQWEDPEGP